MPWGFRPPATATTFDLCAGGVEADAEAEAEADIPCFALANIVMYPISIYICVRIRTQSLTALSASVLAAGVGAKTMAVASARSVDSCLAARPEILTSRMVSMSHLKLSGVRVIRRTQLAHWELTCCGVW